MVMTVLTEGCSGVVEVVRHEGGGENAVRGQRADVWMYIDRGTAALGMLMRSVRLAVADDYGDAAEAARLSKANVQSSERDISPLLPEPDYSLCCMYCTALCHPRPGPLLSRADLILCTTIGK